MRLLREERQYALLFFGQALSMVGDRITFVALPFAVLAIGGDAADVGLVAASATIPFAVFALAGGVWADRLPRQRVMVASDLVRFATQAVAAVLLLTDTAEVWHLAGLMAVFGTADAFFAPAYTGLIPQTVSPERLQEANALRGLTASVSMVSGPAAAGALVALAGPGVAFAVDAATFLVSVAFLSRLRPAAVAERTTGEGFWSQLQGGYREVRSRSWVWSFLGAMAVYHVVVLPSVFVLGPVLAEEEYGGAASWALVTIAFGLGSILGDAIGLRWKPDRPLAVAAVAMVVASCQAAIIGSGLPIEAIAALEAVTGVGVTLFFTLWEFSLQAHVPEEAVSRVSSYDYLCSVGLMPVGLALAGPAADALGVHELLAVMTAIGIPASLALLLVPSVRRLGRGRAAALPAGP